MTDTVLIPFELPPMDDIRRGDIIRAASKVAAADQGEFIRHVADCLRPVRFMTSTDIKRAIRFAHYKIDRGKR